MNQLTFNDILTMVRSAARRIRENQAELSRLDSAIGGVLQGIIVLFALLGGGFQARHMHRRLRSAPATLVGE